MKTPKRPSGAFLDVVFILGLCSAFYADSLVGVIGMSALLIANAIHQIEDRL